MNNKKILLIIINMLLILYLLCLIIFINNDKVKKAKEIIQVSNNFTENLFIKNILNNISYLFIFDINENNILLSKDFKKNFKEIKDIKKRHEKFYIIMNEVLFKVEEQKLNKN